MVSQAGSDQVMNTIKGFAGNGTIGYVEYSYPINTDYPVVKVLNKAGYFVEPTQYNIAVALTKAKINQDKSSQLYLTQILDGVYANPDPRAYPISSYSYMIIPTGADDPRMTHREAADARRLHVLLALRGPDQGRPVRLLAAAAQPGAGRLRAARQAEDGRPDGRPHRPRRALVQQPDLRRQEPQPRTCSPRSRRSRPPATRPARARAAPTPAPASPRTDDAERAGDRHGGGDRRHRRGDGAGAGDRAGPAPGPAVDAPPRGRPRDRSTVTAGGDRRPRPDGAAIYANPTELAAARTSDDKTFGWLAVLELLALVLLPGLYVVTMRRRRAADGSARVSRPSALVGLVVPPLARSSRSPRWPVLARRAPADGAARRRRRHRCRRPRRPATSPDARPRRSTADVRRRRRHDATSYPRRHRHGDGRRRPHPEPARSRAGRDHLVGRPAERRPGQQPVRRERAQPGVPRRDPAVPRLDDPACRRPAARPRPAGPSSVGAAVADPALRVRGGLDATTSHADAADKERVIGHGRRSRRRGVPDDRHRRPLLHPPHAVRRRQGHGLPGLRRRPHAARGGRRRGLPARRDRRVHRRRRQRLGPVRGAHRRRERVARLQPQGGLLDRGDPDRRHQLRPGVRPPTT